jgi:hypothetical protein
MSSTVGSLVGHAEGSGQLLGIHTLQIPTDFFLLTIFIQWWMPRQRHYGYPPSLTHTIFIRGVTRCTAHSIYK